MGAPAGYAETTVEAWKQRALASEKRASEAERTFADLRNLIEKNLVVMADLVRERDEARLRLSAQEEAALDLIEVAETERDEARAALGKIRDSEPGTLSIELRRIAESALTHTGNK